ncbi:nuclear pore complex protein An-Nup82 [Colletotrichum navitas]|uniref:Nuclear pore complex protein An-Nup82 n=1 Tax=Colletotrichum navitas TaxID=681940 RepID=A0AAD8QC74_9PEZI|nr:nuclear pore complex protein An-Nup82 [Colletotrichum navitas]KAK1599022.1 nuclear pore complex protein An-Nup82 [Colletotrichum navitas]
MPKVKSYSAPWLSHGPGHQLFAPSSDAASKALSVPSPYMSKKKKAPGPRRTIARRGTEVFVAVGKELRWGDLAYLKEKWSTKHAHRRMGSRVKREDSAQAFDDEAIPSTEEAATAQGFRTIKTPVADDIRQLVISPNSDFLAILTTHTVHICVVPDSSHLTAEDTGPLRPKIWTLGPTTHVTSRSSVASAVWHPLGVKGSCLVTITTDAIVRLWELSLTDRWSFDSPTLSIDLKKLVDGTTLDQDFTASTAATNASFSQYSLEMQVASACFASRGSGGWSPMTLWVAMREGDVYALSPLLPQKWAPPPTLIPSLSVSIVSKVAALEDDPTVSEKDKLLAQQQLEWMGDLDSQEPQVLDTAPGEEAVEVYTRPSRPGVIPRLQGPFGFDADPDSEDVGDSLLTDIIAIGKKIDTDDLMMGEDEDLDFDDGEHEGLSLSVICLLSTTGQVRVYLDLEGVEAQWLPPRNKSKLGRLLAAADPPSLLTFQCIDTMTGGEMDNDAWPTFSSDAMSRYSLFVTCYVGITFLSFSPWVFRLEGELSGESEAGSDFRLGLLVNGQNSIRERLYTHSSSDVNVPLAASAAIRDPDLGYFLLSATPYEPIALTFDTPDDDLSPIRHETPFEEKPATMEPLDFYEPRPTFQPSHAFEQQSDLPELINRLRSSRHKTILNQEIRLSPVTLQILTDAHRILGEDTYRLGTAVAEIFRRCATLQDDLKDQIKKANEVKEKIDKIAGNDKDGEGESDDVRFERRITEAQERQKRLNERLEGVHRYVGKATTRELSAKEKAFVEEVRSMGASVLGSLPEDGPGTRQQKKLKKRLEDVQQLRDELVGEVERIQKQSEGGKDGKDSLSSSSTVSDLKIPTEIRKAKLQQVMSLLSRETALVEAVSSRLERLQTQ